MGRVFFLRRRFFVQRLLHVFRAARIFRALGARQRTQHQVDGAAHQLGREIGMAERLDRGDEFLDDLEADLGVRHFAAAKFQRDFHLHVFAQEIDRVLHLDAEVVRVNARA